jgi:hypothetical protein
LLEPIDCEGAPRDLGVAQGRACRAAVRDHVARSGAALRRRRYPVLTPWSSGSVVGRGAGREIVRHYPHLAERMAGLALGADLPFESLVGSLLAPASTSSAALCAPALALACEESAAGGVLAVRTLVQTEAPGAAWVLRRSRPEVGFASVEITLPWLASAVAGVNAEGVAAVLAHTAASSSGGVPPLLLVQECLQRFASIDGCLDWCLKRSAEGNATIFLAHPSGGVAAVEFDGSERRVIRPSDGLLFDGVSASAEAELRKLRGQASDPSRKAGAFDWATLAGEEIDRSRTLSVELDPSACRMVVQRGGASGSGRRAELVAA